MFKIFKNSFVLDFAAALMFFTRIPVKWDYFSNEAPDLTKAAWTFPLIGYVIGILSGFFGDLCLFFELSNFLSCSLAIALSILLTGAFHEDGLADTADGFGAGGSSERINEIMHDSRLGTYGVISLILVSLTRFFIILGLVNAGYSLIIILSCGFATGKLAIIITRIFFNPSKYTMTGSIIGSILPSKTIVAILIWITPIFLIFPTLGIIIGIIFVIVTIYIIGKKSTSLIGGITGDVLGAIALLSEVFFLLGLLIILGEVS